jgi:hypothetical protein
MTTTTSSHETQTQQPRLFDRLWSLLRLFFGSNTQATGTDPATPYMAAPEESAFIAPDPPMSAAA